MTERLRRRPFTVLGVLVGLILASLVIFRSPTVREIVKEIGGGETKIVADHENPCNDLNTRACAIKLFAALPDSQRKKLGELSHQQLIKIVQHQLRQRGRNATRRHPPSSLTPNPSPGQPPPAGPGAGAAPPPSPGSPAPGGGGIAPRAHTVNPNPLTTPQIGPVGPVIVQPPTIDVPGVRCVPVPLITTCREEEK